MVQDKEHTISCRLRNALRHGNYPSANILTFTQPKIVSVAKRIAQTHKGMGQIPPAFELESIYQIFLNAIKNNNLELVTISDWKKSPWVLRYGAEELAENAVFMKYLSKVLMNTANTRLWNRLIHMQLLHYGKSPQQKQSDKTINSWIREAFTIPALKEDLAIWQERNSKIGLFEEANLNIAVKYYLSNYVNNTADFWRDFGLTGDLEAGGYSSEVARILLSVAQRMLTERPELVNVVWDYVMQPDGVLRFPLLKKMTIECLLEPWSETPPPSSVRQNILAKLMSAFKDPRFRTNSAHWSGISDTAIKVIRKWLAAITIEQFFEIIDKTGKEEHWEYRKAFWKAYIKKQFVDDACVALGRDAYTMARSILEKDATAAAILNDANKVQCVLLIKIADLTIAEFNQNGKCRFWESFGSNAPKLHQEEYSDKALRVAPPLCSEALSHHGSKHYTWQQEFAKFIYGNTGYYVNQKDFTV